MSKITNDGLTVWHRMLSSCSHKATVDVKGLSRGGDLDDRSMYEYVVLPPVVVNHRVVLDRLVA